MWFFVALAGVAWLAIALNTLIIGTLIPMIREEPVRPMLASQLRLMPGFAINIFIAVAAAVAYDEIGIAAALLMLGNAIAFAYMAKLLVTARERTRQYAALSWGVLSGLMRTLDQRDGRAARHAAAVARFSRDIAATVGLSEPSRNSPTRPACCTTSAASGSPTASWSAGAR